MNGKSKQFNLVLLLATVSLVWLVVVGGCKKSEPEGPTVTVPKVDTVTAVAGEQTMCPVMGGAIDKNIFVEYKGKKVYFCCAACKEKFEAEPEKYLAKLPQFKL
ncbi:MAG: YHS domain-containing protein [Phycisphaerae bacterium]|nr:YHS domain-containing protein [Phycisphaerae bacterium]